MDIMKREDAIVRRMQAMNDRLAYLRENELYYYNQPARIIQLPWPDRTPTHQ